MTQYSLQKYKVILFCVACVTLFSCASTKIVRSWVDPSNNTTYKHLLIIGIGESEQTRRAYESYFVDTLKQDGIEAEASYRLIKSNVKIDKETVTAAIKGLDIDGVIVTHLVAVDEETVYRPSMDYMTVYGRPGYGGVYSGSLYSYYPHVNAYVHRPGYYTTHESYTLETSLYDVKSEELVWSARTRSFSPESVDDLIVELTGLMIKDMENKKLIAGK